MKDNRKYLQQIVVCDHNDLDGIVQRPVMCVAYSILSLSTIEFDGLVHRTTTHVSV